MKSDFIKTGSCLSTFVFLVFFFFSPASLAQNYSKIVAFGDSWTDPVASDPDGPSYARVLSGLMSLPIDNYALSGAITAEINGQIGAYIANGIDPDALHIYWAVGNDFLEPGGQDDTSATNALMATNAGIGLDLLLQAGAQNFLIFNSIDNGLRPIAISMGGEAQARAVSIEYNQLMSNVLATRGLQLSLFDSFVVFSDLVRDGRFTNITQGCSDVGCNNPNEFVWWDDIHPSSESHRLIADVAFAQVTAPAGASPPQITSNAPLTATVGSSYSYNVEAMDADIGSVLTYGLIDAPTGMVIDAPTGVVAWTPSIAHVGANSVAITVTDNDGLTDTQAYSINVLQQSTGGGGSNTGGGGGGGGSADWLFLYFLLTLVLGGRGKQISAG